MNKEVIIAIIAGGVIGIAIAFGVWRANIALSPIITPSAKPLQTLLPKTSNKDSLIIASPNENEVFISNSLVLSGLTEPDSLVIISGENADYFIKSSVTGEFEKNIELAPGVNQILVARFDKNHKKTEKKLTVIYSAEFAKYSVTQVQTDNPSLTPEQKADQKLANDKSAPTSYRGTITDISDTTIEIKSTSGEIQQISIERDKTSYAKVDTVSKQIEFKDIAIGDFLVALGYKNGNSVLNAKRILITNGSSEIKRKIISAKINSVTKNTLNITDLENNSELTLGTDKSTKMYVLKDTLKQVNLKDLLKDSLYYLSVISGEKIDTVRSGVNNLISPETKSPASTIIQ